MAAAIGSYRQIIPANWGRVNTPHPLRGHTAILAGDDHGGDGLHPFGGIAHVVGGSHAKGSSVAQYPAERDLGVDRGCVPLHPIAIVDLVGEVVVSTVVGVGIQQRILKRTNWAAADTRGCLPCRPPNQDIGSHSTCRFRSLVL